MKKMPFWTLLALMFASAVTAADRQSTEPLAQAERIVLEQVDRSSDALIRCRLARKGACSAETARFVHDCASVIAGGFESRCVDFEGSSRNDLLRLALELQGFDVNDISDAFRGRSFHVRRTCAETRDDGQD